MRKTQNIIFLAILAVAFISILANIYLLHQLQEKEKILIQSNKALTENTKIWQGKNATLDTELANTQGMLQDCRDKYIKDTKAPPRIGLDF